MTMGSRVIKVCDFCGQVAEPNNHLDLVVGSSKFPTRERTLDHREYDCCNGCMGDVYRVIAKARPLTMEEGAEVAGKLDAEIKWRAMQPVGLRREKT